MRKSSEYQACKDLGVYALNHLKVCSFNLKMTRQFERFEFLENILCTIEETL